MLFLITFSMCVVSSTGYLKNNACKRLQDYASINVNPSCYFNPDVGATTPEIIKNHGFHVESHFVTTSDGYILQLFRIPPRKEDNRRNKQPIFFNHGILSDSSAFVFGGDRTLALSLARDGYDIWLNNQRGSKYSSGHISLDVSSREYWNWTVDTVAANDIPPTLEKIANVTGKAGSIIYIGHSRGNILAFMYALNNPQAKLLRGIVALAPVAYHDAQAYVRLAFELVTILQNSLPGLRIWSLFQNPDFIMNMAQLMCPLFPETCKFILSLFSGVSDQFPPEDLLNFFSHFPSAYSISEYLHERQLIGTGQFQKYDYGEAKNLELYGHQEPFRYDLSKISLPVYLFYARNDIFASEPIVKRQFHDLGSQEKGIFKIPIGIDDKRFQWAHNDFLYGKGIQKYLYKPLKKVLEKNLQPKLS